MSEVDEELIAAAFDLIARANDGENHTVAAAVRTAGGAIVTGLNLYHFTGGPCAEVVALANVAALRAEALTIVAVNTRAVMSPCGRCRQTMLDYWPDASVIVGDGDGKPVTLPVRDLLPLAYRANR